MPTEIKTHLIKTLIIPAIDYPPVPIDALSNNQLGILQRIQKALRFAFNQRYPYTLTTEQLHELAKIEPVNIRLYNKAVQTWEKRCITSTTIHNANTEHGKYYKISHTLP